MRGLHDTMKTAILRGGALPDREALHGAISAQLGFPAWYGGNLDALYDLLTERPGAYRFLIENARALERDLGGRYYASLLHVLEDAGVAYTLEDTNLTPRKEKCSMQTCTHPGVDLSLLEETLDEYAGVRGSLISILQKTQEIYGYIPIDAVYHISERTGNSPAKILGVATFYSQFRFQAIGKYLILLCKGTACYVNGADRILDAVTDELGIHDNETTEDGLFSLSVVSCLGCCSLAPVMMINDKTYGSLTPDKVKQILRDLRKEAAE